CADFTAYVQQVKDQNPDYLSLTLVGNNFIAKLPQQLREMGVLDHTTMSCSIVDFDFLKTMGANGVGLTGECIYHYNLYDTPVNEEFIKIHQELYNGEYPDYWAGESFVGGQAIVEAIKKADSTDADAVIAALEGLELNSIKGDVYIRAEDHQLMQPHAVGKIVDDGNGGTTVELEYLAPIEEMTFPVNVPE
ncbi:MAG: ABC transporter substrate-binding protein, partial [Lachnospiraceae bacterium]|nr:ABC transporter substrate-binding protein [Lachnospiraceae bacterium]